MINVAFYRLSVVAISGAISATAAAQLPPAEFIVSDERRTLESDSSSKPYRDYRAHTAFVESATAVILAQRGYPEALSHPVVAKRLAEIVTHINDNLTHNEKFHDQNLEIPTTIRRDQDPEYIREHLNSMVFTLATDALYILSDRDKSLINERRQYNTFRNMAEKAFTQAMMDNDIPDDAVEAGLLVFHEITAVSDSYFEVPRFAALEGYRSQEAMAVAIVEYQRRLDGVTMSFVRVLNALAPLPQNQAQADDPLFLQRRAERIQTAMESMARMYAAYPISYFIGTDTGTGKPQSPVQVLGDCWGVSCGMARHIHFHIAYEANPDFDAMKILQDWWANPVAPAR